MIWVLGVLCALALVALFFPFIFWIDFSAGLDGVCVQLLFFKKTLYTYKKKFGKEVPSEKAETPSEKEDIPSEKENAPSEEEVEAAKKSWDRGMSIDKECHF